MANGNATITVSAKLAAAYNAAPRTKRKKVQSAMWQALRESGAVEASLKPADFALQEAELLLRIRRNLPDKQRTRYHELSEKRAKGKLNSAEYAELLRLIDESETVWAERVEALGELARLRGVAPVELMKQLGIKTPAYE